MQQKGEKEKIGNFFKNRKPQSGQQSSTSSLRKISEKQEEKQDNYAKYDKQEKQTFPNSPTKEEHKIDESINDFLNQGMSQLQEKDKAKISMVESNRSFKQSTFQQTKKRSPGKFMPYKYNKLSEKEREDYFLRTQKENENLKIRMTEFESEIKIMNTKYNKLTQSIAPQEQQEENSYEMYKLQKENKQLKEKLLAMSQATHTINRTKQNEKKTLYSTQMKQKENDQKQNSITEILKVNDLLKQRLQKSELQLKTVQEAMQKMQQQNQNQKQTLSRNNEAQILRSQVNQLESKIIQQTAEIENHRNNFQDAAKQLKEEKIHNLELQKKLKLIEATNKNSDEYETEIQNLKMERDKLNEQYRQLANAPFMQDFIDIAEKQAKITTLQSQLESNQLMLQKSDEMQIKYEKEIEMLRKDKEDAEFKLACINEQRLKLEGELKVRDKKLLYGEGQMENDEFFNNLGVIHWKGEDPKWLKLNFIERQEIDIKDNNQLFGENEKLTMEKGELAAQLEQTRMLLKVQAQVNEQALKAAQDDNNRLQKQLSEAIKNADNMARMVELKGDTDEIGKEVFIRQNIKYDDNVSIFSVDSTELEEQGVNGNIFDLFLAEINLDPELIQLIVARETSQAYSSIDTKNLITFVTVDFYDHDTQHSSVVEGLQSNYNFQISFNVNCNAMFLRYLDQEQLKIELYASYDQPVRLGFGFIELKKIIDKNQKNGISAVITDSIKIFDDKQQLFGILEYKMRMRFPINQNIKWDKEKQDLDLDLDLDIESTKSKRNLQIIVENADLSFSSKIKPFVFYNFNGKDYYTQPEYGAMPKWNYQQAHQVMFDNEFIKYANHEELEFIIFDDEVKLDANEFGNNFSDWIGSANISLQPLLKNSNINIVADVYNLKKQKKGTISIKIFWLDSQTFKMPEISNPEEQKKKITDLELRYVIGYSMKQKSLSTRQAFKLLNSASNTAVTLNQWVNFVLNALTVPVHRNQVENFYYSMKQPVDYDTFREIFAQYLDQPYSLDKQPQLQQQSSIGEHLALINKEVKQNTLSIEQQQYYEKQEQFKKEKEMNISQQYPQQQIYSRNIDDKSFMQQSYGARQLQRQKTSKEKTDEIVERISKKLKEKNIKPVQLFNMIDTDKSSKFKNFLILQQLKLILILGSISVDELKEVFDKMKLEVNFADTKEIFNEINKGIDQEIKIYDFVEYFERF